MSILTSQPISNKLHDSSFTSFLSFLPGAVTRNHCSYLKKFPKDLSQSRNVEMFVHFSKNTKNGLHSFRSFLSEADEDFHPNATLFPFAIFHKIYHFGFIGNGPTQASFCSFQNGPGPKGSRKAFKHLIRLQALNPNLHHATPWGPPN